MKILKRKNVIVKDLIIAAYNDAKDKIKKTSEEIAKAMAYQICLLI